MRESLKPRSIYDVFALIGCVAAVGGGTAYAANTIGSADIIDESVQSADIKNGEIQNADLGVDSITSTRLANGSIQNSDLGPDAVTTSKIKAGAVGTSDLADGAVATEKLAGGGVTNDKLADGSVGPNKLQDGSVTSAKVLDDTQAGGGLGPSDLATNAVGQAEIATDGVAATEIQNDAIDAGEIVDFGLTNQDVGVLFAEVSATATLDNHSGGVTLTRVGAVGGGEYEVDFGRPINLCTAVATLGTAAAAAAVRGEVSVTDRSSNLEAVFVATGTSAGVAADRPFRLVVVC